MARPRSRLLDLERDDIFYGGGGDHVSVAIHAIAAWTILFLLLQLTAGLVLPHAAVCAAIYGAAYYFFLDRNALLGFLCWAASGALAARLGFSNGWKVLHTFAAGCQPRPSFRAETPPPSVHGRA